MQPFANASAHGRAFAHIAQFHPELTAFRRDLHAHPELGFEEIYTSGRVQQAMALCGVDKIQTGLGKTGVVAVVHGKTNTRNQMVALRADMDALPLIEQNDCAWKSSKTGLMHACGHDGHTAMLVGAARYLAETRNFDGTAVLVFQPGEEGFAGARAMIQDGLFDQYPVQAAYAIHNSPETPVGIIGLTPGPMQAAVDRIEIVVTGKGGHGARPQNCIDPILVAAHIITAAQSIVSRNVAAIEQVVLSICSIHGGNPGAMSVIPGSVTLVGTVRTYHESLQDKVESRLRDLCESIAAGFGASAVLTYERVYPATVNTEPETEFAANVAAKLVGESRVIRNMPPSMGGEDFSFMLQVVPGAYMRLGQGNVNGCMLHNNRYDFNDDVLPLGSALYASLIEEAMPLVHK
ncbi:MAG TPA: M20 aminoacylase family protein [Burkholderiaceae bacterium]|nr:M20 aminoacylase family protein [Burkholderiaceae bacterium]